jgi:hypothetical protein
VTLPEPTAPGCHQAVRDFTGVRTPAANGFNLEYKFRLATALGRAVDLGTAVAMESESGDEKCSYYLEVAPAGMRFAVQREGGTEENFMVGRSALVDEWTPIVVDVHGAPGGRKLTVAVGGVVAIDDAAIPSYCQNGTFVTAAAVGVSCGFTGAGDLDVAFDDVRVIAR